MVRVLADDDVAALLELESLLPVVADAFRADYRDEVTRPDRPHYPIGTGLDAQRPDESLGTGLCMPAYVHGGDYAVTKLVGVFEGNRDHGLPTVSAQISVTDARTGQPVAYLDGTRVTNARTGCIGGLAVCELAAPGPLTLGIVGAGTQARWQARAIAAAVGDRLDSMRIYSPSESRERCASDLERELGVEATPVSTPEDAVSEASVVVTATTSDCPVFQGSALAAGALVVAVGAYTPSMRELDETTIDRAATVFADVPAEAVETGDLRPFTSLELVPFGAVCAGDAGREADDDVVVLASVGSAVLDAAVAEYVVDRAREASVGTTVGL